MKDQASIKFVILLLTLPHECWGYRFVPQIPFFQVTFFVYMHVIYTHVYTYSNVCRGLECLSQ